MKIQIRTLLIALTVSVALPACKNNSGFSGDHLSPKVMQNVLLDINLAEAYSLTIKDSLHRTGAKNMDSLAVFYKDIFAHYHITQEQFTESLNWYKNHAEDLDSAYTNMIPIVTKWQSQPLKSN